MLEKSLTLLSVIVSLFLIYGIIHIAIFSWYVTLPLAVIAYIKRKELKSFIRSIFHQ